MAFSFWKALGYGVSRVRERPVEALRIWAVDAVVLCAVLAVWFALASQGGRQALTTQLPSLPLPQAMLAMLAAAIAVFGWLCSQGAWARFLATDRPTPILPYRLGRDEGRIFGSYVTLGLILVVAGVLVATPFVIIGVGFSAGGVELPGMVHLLPLLFAVMVIFVAARVAAVPMLAVRRQEFSPLGHFTATDPFWFRLGLAFLVASVLTLALAQGLPSLLATFAGVQPPVRLQFGTVFSNGWVEWLAAKQSRNLLSIAIVVLAIAAHGLGALVLRGVAAHAALNALEQEEMDARRALPTTDSSAA